MLIRAAGQPYRIFVLVNCMAVAASPLNFDGNPFAMHPEVPQVKMEPCQRKYASTSCASFHRFPARRVPPCVPEIQNRQGSWVEFDNDVKSGAPIDSVPGTSDYGSTQTGTSDQNFIARDQSHASHGPEPSGEQPLIDLGITDEEKKETSGPSLESFLQEEFYHRISSALKSRLANLTIGNRETLQEFYEEILAATLIQSAQLKKCGKETH
ncbi:hypothetical protein KEM48_007853 [Puccinia striiformis f. sp. tritici PST-130]|nr:hypothetical protein KEM48_007853 [Puccinia striiformis f. sp. tritici PST-130]